MLLQDKKEPLSETYNGISFSTSNIRKFTQSLTQDRNQLQHTSLNKKETKPSEKNMTSLNTTINRCETLKIRFAGATNTYTLPVYQHIYTPLIRLLQNILTGTKTLTIKQRVIITAVCTDAIAKISAVNIEDIPTEHRRRDFYLGGQGTLN